MSKEEEKDMKYVAIADGLHSRELVPITYDFKKYISKKSDKDIYFSLYKYNKRHYDKFKETRSLAGITDVKTDKLLFDFDDSANLDNARADAIEITNRLIQHGIPKDKIGIYFSGGKGFHVEVKTQEEFNRTEFENIVYNLSDGLQTYDTAIVDEQRIVRAPLTKHPHSNLYKIPISINQLNNLNCEKIKVMAGHPEQVSKTLMDRWDEVSLPDSILELKTKSTKKQKTEIILDETLSFEKYQLDLTKCPKWLSPERYALQEGFFYGSESVSVGERNNAFMILASTYLKNGINKNIALNMLKATAELQSARTGESVFPESELKKTIIDVVYKNSWNGGIYSADHMLLKKTRQRFDIPEIKQATDFISSTNMFSSFVKYASNIDGNTIKTGLPIDNYIKLTIGMPVALLGAPSSGKTTCALNILRNTSKQGIHSLFFSMDMHRALVCQKQLQLLYKDTPEQIYRKILDPKKAEKYVKGLDENFKNVSYITKAGLTIDEIRNLIEKKKEQIGDSLKLVMIDYMECIRGPFSDATSNSAIIADGIKNIAVELDVCVILLVQPPKITGGAAYPLTNMYNIKGSSMVAQAMRVIIGIYREGFSPDTPYDDNFITFVGLKNTMGNLFKQDCAWNGSRGEITLLDEIGEMELKNLRDRLKQERSNNDF